MGICAHCGNEYDRSFDVTSADGDTSTYDCFQCAIADMAPECTNCGCKIIGQGRETDGDAIYCGAHCAEQDGAELS